MDCSQITQADVAIRILQNPADDRLQQLFKCIYRLFQESFLNWVTKRFGGSSDKAVLREDAKDAFQNGVIAFYNKAREKEFILHNSLKTILYSFGCLQLLALFKRERKQRCHSNYVQALELFFADNELDVVRHQMLNEKELTLITALSSLPPRMREILVLKFFEKLKSKEIARRLHMAPGSVDNEASKAFKQLRQILTTAMPVDKT